MAVAFLSGMRSKDPATQVGACIINADKKRREKEGYSLEVGVGRAGREGKGRRR